MERETVFGLPLAWTPILPGGGHRAGRELLERLYASVQGGPLPEIGTGPWGKPDFLTGSWHFSISHTPHFAFCVLSPQAVGLDAEELSRKAPERLAQKVLSPGEWARYRAAPDPGQALLTFWVLKEAQAKCSGRGLTHELCQTDFRLDDPRVFRLAGCVAAIVQEERHAL